LIERDSKGRRKWEWEKQPMGRDGWVLNGKKKKKKEKKRGKRGDIQW
jgi:hypothetical protein